jgi:hypothetical protein
LLILLSLSLANALTEFLAMLWSMYGRGLAKSAVRVMYYAVSSDELAARRFAGEVNQYVFMMDVKRSRKAGRLP